jgi:hypothetical protein
LTEPFVVKNGYAVAQFHQRFATLVRKKTSRRAVAVAQVSGQPLDIPPELFEPNE